MKPIINDYVFYKIINDDLPEYTYIGSSCNFIRRKCEHKITCNNPNRKGHHLKIYQIIRNNGGWEKWDMVMIDKLDQTTLLDARIKEEELRLKYDGNLNTNKAYQTVEELNEHRKQHKKEYHESNKEAISEKWNEYYKKNKEALSEKKKEHYESNKETILEKMKEKMTCECGSIFAKKALNRHLNTLKHQQFCQPIDLSI